MEKRKIFIGCLIVVLILIVLYFENTIDVFNESIIIGSLIVISVISIIYAIKVSALMQILRNQYNNEKKKNEQLKKEI